MRTLIVTGSRSRGLSRFRLAPSSAPAPLPGPWTLEAVVRGSRTDEIARTNEAEPGAGSEGRTRPPRRAKPPRSRLRPPPRRTPA